MDVFPYFVQRQQVKITMRNVLNSCVDDDDDEEESSF